jgi:cysteine desulfurase/selenocysteine lyase
MSEMESSPGMPERLSAKALSDRESAQSIEHASTSEEFPGSLRRLFPITEQYVYLNHASVAPLSRPAREAMVRALDGSMYHGPRISEEMDAVQATTRSRAAKLVNAEAHQFAFLRNTSDALSAVANGISWCPGDNLVTTSVEFPANVYPWQRIAEAQGIELRVQNQMDGYIDVDELLRLVDGRTRVVTISWVQFSTGQRLDLRRIGNFCHERDILFVVDAVQGLGALQLDVRADAVDAFAAGAQKFLLGPKGISLLYLSDRALERVKPTVIGWTAVKGYSDYLSHDLDFRDGAIRFEGGTLNVPGICGLGEALDLFLRVGLEKIENHLLALSDYFAQELSARGYRVTSPLAPNERSAILTCRHPQFTGEQICAHLDSQNIIVSARLEGLRIAPHFYNTREEADALVAALPG